MNKIETNRLSELLNLIGPWKRNQVQVSSLRARGYLRHAPAHSGRGRRGESERERARLCLRDLRSWVLYCLYMGMRNYLSP